MKQMHKQFVLFVGLLAITLNVFAAEAAKPASLFDRLGGLPALAAVTDDFLGRLAQDPAVTANKHVTDVLASTNLTLLKFHIINQLCEATGGPCKYTGRTMKDSHKHLLVTEAEWNASATDLKATLDKFKVPQQEQDEVFAYINSLKADIVVPAK